MRGDELMQRIRRDEPIVVEEPVLGAQQLHGGTNALECGARGLVEDHVAALGARGSGRGGAAGAAPVLDDVAAAVGIDVVVPCMREGCATGTSHRGFASFASPYVVSGEHDEATPAVVRPLVDALPDAHWELLPGASHCAHLEQPERFLALVEAFLAAHDRVP